MTAFVAYSSKISEICRSMESFAKHAASIRSDLIKIWPHLPIIGYKLDDMIRDEIEKSSILFADITDLNFNVFYEIGYAIGANKPIFLLKNSAFENKADTGGLFDTLGTFHWQNSDDLKKLLNMPTPKPLLSAYASARDHIQPLFILDSAAKTEFRNDVIKFASESGVKYRIFDPDELSSLSFADAVGYVTKSSAILLFLQTSDIKGSFLNNLRASFMAGLADAMGIEYLFIQNGNSPAPADYRDLITRTNRNIETKSHVESICHKALILNQSATFKTTGVKTTLQKIHLGASAAENEETRLNSYFLETAEYNIARESEGCLIVGRKGSGKTAIFQMLALNLKNDKTHAVIELKPTSHRLSDLRAHLASLHDKGIFGHTISAFWRFVLYSELLSRLHSKFVHQSRYNTSYYDLAQRIHEIFEETKQDLDSSFAERLESAVALLLNYFNDSTKEIKSSEITNVLFINVIPRIRAILFDVMDLFDDITILFDNIDKGWPATGLTEGDAEIVHSFIEELHDLQRDCRRKDISLRYAILLRNDVYDLLIERTSDRGKYNKILVDWTDRDRLLKLIHKRVETSQEITDSVQAWTCLNHPLSSGRYALDLLIDHSLMRPRLLIELTKRAQSYAINRNHSFLVDADVEDAIKDHSKYLVSEFAFEMRDVAGVSEDLIFNFIGASELLTEEEVCRLSGFELGTAEASGIIKILIWFGFLGVYIENKPRYIYEEDYDFRRFSALMNREGKEIFYSINPAFVAGLKPVS